MPHSVIWLVLIQLMRKQLKAKLPPIDSMNMWPLISGLNSTSPRTDIPASNFTLISGDYKIITGNQSMSVWTGPHSPNTTSKGLYAMENCGDGCLFNIKTGPTEHDNLATKMPDVLEEMQRILKKYQDTHFNLDRGKKWPEACTTFLNKYGGFWGPFPP